MHGGGRDKRSILLSQPVEIMVTCITPPTGAAPRFYPYQHWGYNESQRIRIQNIGDRYCLFYALIASRAYHDYELRGILSTDELAFHKQMRGEDFCANNHAFERFVSSIPRMYNQAMKLIREAEISPYQEAYGLDEIDAVQRLWVSKFLQNLTKRCNKLDYLT